PPPEPAADRLGEDQEYAEGGYNHDLPWRAKANRDRGEEHAAREEADQPDPRPVMEAHQRIRRGRAERQRDDGARQADDDRVDVRADSVVAKVHEDVAPVLEGRLEVDEREEDRPGVDLDGQL